MCTQKLWQCKNEGKTTIMRGKLDYRSDEDNRQPEPAKHRKKAKKKCDRTTCSNKK